MAMISYLVFDKTTGDVLRNGTCLDTDLAGQATSENEVAMAAPSNAIVVTEVNLTPVRETLYRKIDSEAEAFRSQFLTPGSGQAITYLRKESEARAFIADDSAPTPLLAAEADAVGMTVSELALEVIANSDLWFVIGTKIEAARRGAKKAVELSQNVAEMHAASQIDWSGLLS